MPQENYTLQNVTFPQARQFLNNVFAAIQGANSGPTAPPDTRAGMPWLDTSTSPPTIRVRNLSNNGWVPVATLDDGAYLPTAIATAANARNEANRTSLIVPGNFADRRRVIVASGGNESDISITKETRIETANFVATTTHIFAVFSLRVSSETTAFADISSEVRVVEVSSGAVILSVETQQTGGGIQGGATNQTIHGATGSLVVGQTYRLQGLVQKAQSVGPLFPKSMRLDGFAL